MKNCNCEHWQICPTCQPELFDSEGNMRPPEPTPLQACQAQVKDSLTDQNEPVAWSVFNKHGRIYFAIGNQSFPVDYIPEDEPDCSAGQAAEWYMGQLRSALKRLSEDRPQPAIPLLDKVIKALADYCNTGEIDCADDLLAGVMYASDPEHQPKQQPLKPQSDIPLTPDQLTVFKYGWKSAEEAHGIGGEA